MSNYRWKLPLRPVQVVKGWVGVMGGLGSKFQCGVKKENNNYRLKLCGEHI